MASFLLWGVNNIHQTFVFCWKIGKVESCLFWNQSCIVVYRLCFAVGTITAMLWLDHFLPGVSFAARWVSTPMIVLTATNSFCLCAGFWKTSGCVIYCQTLQHEQKQSGQPVLQCGSGRLHLHSFKTFPEFKAHWLWSSGNCLVSAYVMFYVISCHNPALFCGFF